MNGTKTFEIRKNDRGFKVGDKIVFEVLANEGHDVREAARHPLNGAVYRIDYILDGFEGLARKYVALSISKEDDHDLTQKQLAQMAGITPSALSALIRFQRDMRVGNLFALADAMRMDPRDLVEKVDE